MRVTRLTALVSEPVRRRPVLIETKYRCGCLVEERRQNATGSEAPSLCALHGLGWEWVRTTDLEAMSGSG